jgi:hypothetical protein
MELRADYPGHHGCDRKYPIHIYILDYPSFAGGRWIGSKAGGFLLKRFAFVAVEYAGKPAFCGFV